MRSLRYLRFVCCQVAFVLTCTFSSNAAPVPYKNIEEAVLEVFLEKDVTDGWKCITSRGQSRFVSAAKYECGKHIQGVTASLESQSGVSASTVIALPLGDFVVEREFCYNGKNRNGLFKVLKGLVVSVDMRLSSGNDSKPTDSVLQRTVENLVKTGESLPLSVCGKPFSVVSLSESARNRFGARLSTCRYDGRKNKVYLLLQDCDAAFADSTYVPATPKGLSVSRRKEEGKIFLR